MRAFITGAAGTTLQAAERAFLREAAPFGLILFARNIESAEQIRRLCGDFREAVGRDAPVLIDQEGGRVQRIRPPVVRAYPPASAYGRLFATDPERAIEACRLGGRLMADDLRRLGITINCAPCVDLPAPGSDAVIGDRAFSPDAEITALLASNLSDGLRAGGVEPVVKHIPGHGRARVDSHKALPVVDASRDDLSGHDWQPFRRLAKAMRFAMTAHVVFSAIDPECPATLSPTVIDDVIRGEIGFGGLLMSDDISMGALNGTIGSRSAAAVAAGCDLVLHCNGVMSEMLEVAANVPPFDDEGRVSVASVAGTPDLGDDVARRYLALMGLAA